MFPFLSTNNTNTLEFGHILASSCQALRAHLHLFTSLTHCVQGSARSSGSTSVGSVYGGRGGIRCASHYQFISSYPITWHCGQVALRAQKHCEPSSACASSPIHFFNALRARLRALLWEYLGGIGVWRTRGNKMCLALSIRLLIPHHTALRARRPACTKALRAKLCVRIFTYSLL